MRGLVFKPEANSYVIPFTNYTVFPLTTESEQDGSISYGRALFRNQVLASEVKFHKKTRIISFFQCYRYNLLRGNLTAVIFYGD